MKNYLCSKHSKSNWFSNLKDICLFHFLLFLQTAKLLLEQNNKKLERSKNTTSWQMPMVNLTFLNISFLSFLRLVFRGAVLWWSKGLGSYVSCQGDHRIWPQQGQKLQEETWVLEVPITDARRRSIKQCLNEKKNYIFQNQSWQLQISTIQKWWSHAPLLHLST